MPVIQSSESSVSVSTSQATSYQQGSETQQSVGLRMIDMLDFNKGSTVLDLGCGTGYLTKVLADKVGPEGKVVAVDPDRERLKIAREKHSASNIEYIQADDKTFPSGQYDLIFSNIVIHWIHDKEALFERVYANLSPGGSFAFTTADGSLPIPEIGRKLFDHLLGPSFLQCMLHEKMVFLDASEYKTLASKTGFTETSVVLLHDYPRWDNLDSYIDSMHGWFQGEFDPTQFDQGALNELKREHGHGPVVQSEPIDNIHATFTKQ